MVRYSRDQKTQFRLPLKLSLLRGSRPKICQGPKNLAHTVPYFILIGSLSAELGL